MTQIPIEGMFASIRNRLGVIVSVDKFTPRDGSGNVHLVQIDYKDDLEPQQEKLVWELEPNASCQHSTRLPDFESEDPMGTEDYEAMLRATRWGAILPYLPPNDGSGLGRLPVCSPLMGSVRVEDYQLVPLHKAMAMPRIALLLADDVGLGKTVEAGLIISELISRRRVGRILVLAPASLRDQWQEEMRDKFSLEFEAIDRASTQKLRKEVGIDANPWRVNDRIVTSYHYLKQPDVLEQFRSACQMPEGSARLPWDLVVVDECHNAMPSAFGDDSDLCRSLREIMSLCEHRLFLSATPHNGRTRSFTGLLEMLDPVRFNQTGEMTEEIRQRVKQVQVRRLKKDINRLSKEPRFCNRLEPRADELVLDEPEEELFLAFEDFRKGVHSAVAKAGRPRTLAGAFAVEILGKRLISCPVAFADSWWRSREGYGGIGGASDGDMTRAGRNSGEEADSDTESEARGQVAAHVVGAWLKNLSGMIDDQVARIDKALEKLGLGKVEGRHVDLDPRHDEKFKRTAGLIKRLLFEGDKWRSDERLIIFTEFKTTLDYLLRRLREKFKDDSRFLCLYGGMAENERRAVRDAFNDSQHGVRVLLATDSASEGLNLQQTARYMLHFDCPWNPMRLEQRIGRLDRHGQARDVQVYHFTSSQSADIRFMAAVITKVDQVREDLGACGELIDRNLRRRLIHGEDAEGVEKELEAEVNRARKNIAVEADQSVASESPLEPLSRSLSLTPDTMRQTLDSALAWGGYGRPQLELVKRESAAPGSWRLKNPEISGWGDVINSCLRGTTGAAQGNAHFGAMRDIAFSPDAFVVQSGRLKIFRPRADTVLMHLANPVLRKGLHTLVRARHPGGKNSVSRWTCRRTAKVPNGYDGLILFSVEELAVNRLREAFQHWVRTVAFPVKIGKLAECIQDKPPSYWEEEAGIGTKIGTKAEVSAAREMLESVSRELSAWLKTHKEKIDFEMKSQMDLDLKSSLKDAKDSFDSRRKELSDRIQNNTIERLEKEISDIQNNQPWLFDELNREQQRNVEEKKEEIARRKKHLEEMRDSLAREQERVTKHVIPKRFSMETEVSVFPVTLEVLLPGGAN